MNIRIATRDDIARLTEIYNFYVINSYATFDTKPATIEERTKWFGQFSKEGPYRLMVACSGDNIWGYSSSSPFRSHPAFIETVEFSVYVDPQQRKQGIGKKLYCELFSSLRNEKIHRVVAAVALPNEASVSLHKSLGFREIGTFHEYAIKNSNYISSVWFERALI